MLPFRAIFQLASLPPQWKEFVRITCQALAHGGLSERQTQLSVSWRSKVQVLMKLGPQDYCDGPARVNAGSWVSTVCELLHFS